VKACTLLLVGVVGQVERLASSLAMHVRSVRFGQFRGSREGARGEDSGGGPGLVSLAGGHGCDGEACLVLPGSTRCIAMSSLRSFLPVRVHPFASPTSFVSFFHIEFWASCLAMAILLPGNTVICHSTAGLLFMAAFEDKAGRGVTEVEESEKVAVFVFFASITAFLSLGDIFINFVQQVVC